MNLYKIIEAESVVEPGGYCIARRFIELH
jgi:hypothetical protein